MLIIIKDITKGFAKKWFLHEPEKTILIFWTKKKITNFQTIQELQECMFYSDMGLCVLAALIFFLLNSVVNQM